jgi:2-methylisocitrate lyase-like PEP mutase family enzyme
VSLDQAIARYRAAVDMKNELDPAFVIMAQCYTRDAVTGGLDECVKRLHAYQEQGGVDWVQFESPHSVDEIKRARAAVKGTLSFMKGKMPRYLSAGEHLALGVNVAWYPGFTHHVMWAAVWEFMREFQKSGVGAWEDFLRKHTGYPIPEVPSSGEGGDKQIELEKRYFKS